MPRDYKYRAAQKKQKKPVPAWLWILVGLLLGAFVMGLAWLKLDSVDRQEAKWVGAKPDRQPQRVEKGKPLTEVPAPKPRFDFYQDLRDKEVLVPDDQLDLRTSRKDETARFQVQVGSFASPADAERLKAELALLGVETRISRAHASGKQWYRVVAGPYLGRSELDKVRSRLKENGHRQLLVRIVP